MRVAIFTETFLPKIDGIVRVACLTLEHLQRHHIETLLIVPEHGIREYAGAKVIGFPSFVNPVYPEGRISIPTPHVYQQVKAFQPDLIHCFHPIWTGLAGLAMAKRLQVASIASFHLDIATITSFYRLGPISTGLQKAMTWAFNQADYTLAPSRLVREQMLHRGIKHVGLWRRGVDADKFHPRYANAEMRHLMSDGHPEDTILLYVGRLAAEKQIQQMREVLVNVTHTRLALVGGGPQEESLRQTFEGLPVKFVGYLQGERLASAFASADIFLFTSAFESFGLVLLEAMASGIPVVSSRVGGAQDMITEGETGYTFAVNDMAAMVQAVQEIVSDPLRRQRMGLAARQAAEAQSWPSIMDELVDYYQAVLEKRLPEAVTTT